MLGALSSKLLETKLHSSLDLEAGLHQREPPKQEDSSRYATPPSLFDWIRHYAALVGCLVLVGLGVGFLYLVLASRTYEVSTLVVETGRRLSPRQLSLVSQAAFRSPAVYGPTIEKVGTEQSPQEFLNESADIRPIPDTNTLMIIGRANSVARARQISMIAARSFVTVADEGTELTDFVLFGESRGASLRPGIGPSVTIVLGASAAFWFGLAVSVIHYRWRRPVLRLERALAISGADHVTLVKGSDAWRGVLRRPRARGLDGEDTAVIFVHPGTGERELDLRRVVSEVEKTGAGSRRVELVWLR